MIVVMPKFSIKDLLISTTLVSAGLSIISLIFYFRLHAPSFDLRLFIPVMSAFFLGCALIGAGMLYPFSCTKVGAVIGLIAGFLFLRLA